MCVLRLERVCGADDLVEHHAKRVARDVFERVQCLRILVLEAAQQGQGRLG